MALPWLESMQPAWAKEQAPPKRVVFIVTRWVYAPALFPETTGTDYELTDYRASSGPSEDFTLFSAYPAQGGEHLCGMTWLNAAPNPGMDGFKNSISVDQYAAGKLGYVRDFLPALSGDTAKSQSYTSSGVMIPANTALHACLQKCPAR